MKPIIKFTGSQLCEAYASTIEGYVKSVFPQTIQPDESVEEFVLHVINGSRDTRQGSLPNVTSQAAILEIIKAAVKEKQPIPILVGAGTKKPKINESVDIAELSTLHILSSLNDCVKKYYAPGIKVTIRLENLTGRMLESDHNYPSMDKYVEDFLALVEILRYENFIEVIPETRMVSLNEFKEEFDRLYPIFNAYLTATSGIDDIELMTANPNYVLLRSNGWQGIIPHIMRNYYFDRYRASYPNRSQAFYIEMLARYFATTMTRSILKTSGAKVPSIQLSFVPPIPGVPEGLHTPRVYYRSVEMKHCKHNLAFWRGKGYLKLFESGEVKICIASWNDLPAGLETGYLDIFRGTYSVRVKADFLLCE